MAIHKRVRGSNNKTHDAAQPIFSFPADPNLAQVIVDAWLNTLFPWQPSSGGPAQQVKLGDALLERTTKATRLRRPLKWLHRGSGKR